MDERLKREFEAAIESEGVFYTVMYHWSYNDIGALGIGNEVTSLAEAYIALEEKLSSLGIELP